jgi:hypothetical protein
MRGGGLCVLATAYYMYASKDDIHLPRFTPDFSRVICDALLYVFMDLGVDVRVYSWVELDCFLHEYN